MCVRMRKFGCACMHACVRKYSEMLKRITNSTGHPTSHFAQLYIIFYNNKIDRGTTFILVSGYLNNVLQKQMKHAMNNGVTWDYIPNGSSR